MGEIYELVLLLPVRGEGRGGVGKLDRSSRFLLGILGVATAGVGIGTSCLVVIFPSPLIACPMLSLLLRSAEKDFFLDMDLDMGSVTLSSAGGVGSEGKAVIG